MRFGLRTRFSAGILALLVLAVLSGLAAQYATGRLDRLVRQSVQEHLAGSLGIAELYSTLDEGQSRANWLIGISTTVVVALEARLFWLLLYEFGTVGEHFRALKSEVADARSSLSQTRSQLFQAERLALVGKLATSMAHEIRSPLTAIKMWLFAIRRAEVPNRGAQPQVRHHIGGDRPAGGAW